VNVHQCIEELLRLARSDLIVRGVSLDNQTTPGLPPAMTDRVQLQQVLLNLIVNACDAMQAIPAQERILTLTTSIEQNALRIGVLDVGVGLPADVETLFQPFHSTKPGGLGMGLAICRMLVEAQGGRLWADRRAARGAAFYIDLPLALEESNPSGRLSAPG
jgi:C4-dicarboxylate-specific signal transduction histidine kinase